MAQQNLDIVIQAQDRTAGAFDSASKQAKGFSDRLEDFKPKFEAMAAAGGAAFAAISGFAIKAISDYGDAEKSAKQLEYAVMNVSHATREQLDATSALADELERKGVLDGDNIKMGLAQLSTFGLSNKAVQGLAKSLSDLAVNQFGVNASGEQLADTANVIAKALNGQFGVLEKSGIRFTEAQKAIIATGTEMEKVKAINEGFQQNLKYTNDVALTTFEGQLAKVRVQLGNVSEGIGQALLPVVQNLLTQVTPVIDKMLQWANANPDLIQKIVVMGGAIAGLVAVVGLLGLALPAITTAFTLLTGPVGLIVAAIALLVINFQAVKNAMQEVWTLINDNFDVMLFFKQIWQELRDEWQTNMLPALQQLWQALQPLLPYLADLGKFIGAVLIVAIAGVVKVIEGWVLILSELFTMAVRVGTYIAETLKPVFDGIASSINFVIDKVEKLINSLGTLWSSMSKFGGSVASSVSSLFGGKVNDAIITPTGRVITPAQDDYIMATKNPAGLFGGSSGSTPFVININGGNYLSETAAQELGASLIDQLRLQFKI